MSSNSIIILLRMVLNEELLNCPNNGRQTATKGSREMKTTNSLHPPSVCLMWSSSSLLLLKDNLKIGTWGSPLLWQQASKQLAWTTMTITVNFLEAD